MKLDYKLVDEHDVVLRIAPAKFLFNQNISVAKEMADKLYETMIEQKGIGLSANQVGIGMQFFVMGYGESRRNIFNPVILEKSEDEVLFKEGCLSFPGLFLNIKRPSWIKVKYQNEIGESKEEIFTGITARVFLHEYDHMQGEIFTEKVSRIKLDLAKKKRAKILKRLIIDVSTQAINEARLNVK